MQTAGSRLEEAVFLYFEESHNDHIEKLQLLAQSTDPLDLATCLAASNTTHGWSSANRSYTRA